MPQAEDSAPRSTPALSRRGLFAAAVAVGLPSGRAGAQSAQAWPTQPVRWINPYPAGGPTDTLSRLYCAKMGEIAGQQFVVENRSGSGGNVGALAIARSAPDGTTFGLGGIASNAIAPTLYPSLPFDPEKDFTFVSGLWRLPNLLIVNLDLPAHSVPELIELLKRNPGRYSFASAGSGTTIHLSGELFNHHAGVDVLHMPYRGSAPALVDLLAGRVHLIFDNIPTALALARQGKVRPLAVTTAQRSPVGPEIPAMAEFLPGFDMTSWTCACGPAAVPRAIVARMSELTRKALESPDLIRSFRDNGAEPFVTTPEEITAYRAAERARLAPLIRASGARVE
jgi:tripartite-type tricarboxylate transporter receptor subunit TctC